MEVEIKGFATPMPFDFSHFSADELAVIGLMERGRMDLNSIRDKEKPLPDEYTAGFLVI